MRVEVPKSQHKYVIGARGTTIQEILRETGVSVETPPPDSPTGTITLHGPHNKIGIGNTIELILNTCISVTICKMKNNNFNIYVFSSV